MKRNNKKGFTIVELVVVIAVIAILAAVLIPTFSGATNKANNSARDQLAKNAHTNYLADCEADELNADLVIKVTQNTKTYYYPVVDGQIKLDAESETAATAIRAAGLTGSTFTDAAGENANDEYDFTDDKNQVDGTKIYVKATTPAT